MLCRIARPMKRPGSSSVWFRQRIPQDVVDKAPRSLSLDPCRRCDGAVSARGPRRRGEGLAADTRPVGGKDQGNCRCGVSGRVLAVAEGWSTAPHAQADDRARRRVVSRPGQRLRSGPTIRRVVAPATVGSECTMEPAETGDPRRAETEETPMARWIDRGASRWAVRVNSAPSRCAATLRR